MAEPLNLVEDEDRDTTRSPDAVKGLDEETAKAVLRHMLEEASNYDQTELAPARALATNAYNARPYGDEVEGRSQMVDSSVRDTIQGMLPSLLRVFVNHDGVVEYVARTPAGTAAAKQATECVRYTFMEENPGYQILYSTFKDALLHKLGIVTWEWQDTTIADAARLTGLTEDGVKALADNPDITYKILGFEEQDGQKLYTCDVSYVKADGRVKVDPVPPEEFLASRNARSLDHAAVVARRRIVRVSDLVAMGHDLETLSDHWGDDAAVSQGIDEIARRDGIVTMGTGTDTADPSTRPIIYTVAYPYMDLDGDGEAELHRFECVGPNFHVISQQPVSHRPFALFIPDPEPHTLRGRCPADDTMDLQRLKTKIWRATLDSLALHLNPRTVIVEGQVSVADVLNAEVGAIIRERTPGATRELVHDFVGRDAFEMLGYVDEQRENRTGQSKAAMGLDADALQSSTKQAVAATLAKAQEKQELIVRTFAETGMTDLFRGLLRCYAEHQQQQKIIRLLGQYVPIAPDVWQTEMDVRIKVGLGVGLTEEKLAALREIAAKQESILQLLGPTQNPLVTLEQYSNTLRRLTVLAGFNDPNEFFNAVDQKALDAKAAQAAQQPPPPSPDMIVAQAQAQKVQAEIQAKQQDTALKQQELALQARDLEMTDARERHKTDIDAYLKAKELEAKYEIDAHAAALKHANDREKNHLNQKPPTRKRQVKLERGPDGRVASMTSTEEPITEGTQES